MTAATVDATGEREHRFGLRRATKRDRTLGYLLLAWWLHAAYLMGFPVTDDEHAARFGGDC